MSNTAFLCQAILFRHGCALPFGRVQVLINTAVSRNKNRQRYEEADVIGVIDDRHIIPVRQQRFAPQYPEQGISKQRGKHGDPRLAQPFEPADVHLVQGIEEIERERPVYGGKGVCEGRRVSGEKRN